MENLETTSSSSPLFSLTFRIPLEDYIRFHLVIGAENEKKGRKKTVLLGWAEFVIGVLLLISLFVSNTKNSLFFYFIIAVMILMGFTASPTTAFSTKSRLKRFLQSSTLPPPTCKATLQLIFTRTN